MNAWIFADTIIVLLCVSALTSLRAPEPQEPEVIYIERTITKQIPVDIDNSTPSLPPLDTVFKPGGRDFGLKMHPILKRLRMHKGIDIGAPKGTAILACGDGYVTQSEWAGGYGRLIEIAHNDSLSSRYAHCSKLFVKQGQFVKQGDTLGLVGSTGRSTCSHLHFEIRKNGFAIDPQNFVYNETLSPQTTRNRGVRSNLLPNKLNFFRDGRDFGIVWNQRDSTFGHTTTNRVRISTTQSTIQSEEGTPM